MNGRFKRLFTSRLARELGVALLSSVLMRLFLLIVFRLHITDTAEEIFLDLVIFLGTSALTLGRKLWAIRGLIGTLLRIHDQTDRGARRIWGAVLRIQIEGNLHDTFVKASSSTGAEFSMADVDLISQLCFRSGNGVYNGTDSNPPSVFASKYSQYLAYQEENLKKKDQPGIRVLLVSEDDLNADLHNPDNRDDFHAFIEWHDNNHIDLLQVGPQKADELRKRYSLPSTDIGIWDDDLAVIFQDVAASQKLNLYICPQLSPRFNQCQNYFLSLLDNSNSLRLISGRVVTKALSGNERNQYKDKVRKQWRD
jgi:hypothetical protein